MRKTTLYSSAPQVLLFPSLIYLKTHDYSLILGKLILISRDLRHISATENNVAKKVITPE